MAIGACALIIACLTQLIKFYIFPLAWINKTLDVFACETVVCSLNFARAYLQVFFIVNDAL